MYIILGTAALIMGIVTAVAVLVMVLRTKSMSRQRGGKRRTSTPPPKPDAAPSEKKHMQFSKFIVALYAFSCIAWITADYVLAFMYQQPINTEVTVTLTTTVVVALLGYYAKSAFEKSSRNKYSLDEDGIPFSHDGEGG